MRTSVKAPVAILGSAITALSLILAACGGGTSSGAGAGGSAVASVSGTVSGGSASALEIHHGVGPAYLIAAFGDIVIPAAHAAGLAGVLVGVDCGNGAAYSGTTDINGKFKILVPNVGSGNCATTFDGTPGPFLNLSLGTQTEIEVTFAAGAVNLVGIEQRTNNQTELEVEVDDHTSDVARTSDDASSDSPSDDAVSHEDDDDSRSIDQATHADDQTGAGTGTS